MARVSCKLRLNGGMLRHSITVQRRQATQNALGENVGEWVDVATLRAEAKPLRGREYFASGQMQAPTDVMFRTRWRNGITPAMRVLWREEPHDIQSVIDVEGAQDVMELMTIKGTRDGR
jgi:SPP1 family predicted phage head-tail adaptor